MATIGISERKIYLYGIDTKSDNVKNFLLYWTTYNNDRNILTSGYQKYANNKTCFLQNEIINSDRYVEIPKIFVSSDRNIMLFPICCSDKECVYKRYYVEGNKKDIELIPICSNERLVELLYWFSDGDKRNGFVKYGGTDVRSILTKLPPHFTAYDYRRIICNYIPPNTSDRKIHYYKYHDKYELPNTYCDGNDYTFNIDSCSNEIIDSRTITDENTSLDFIGVDEGFDYGELFLVDKFNKRIYNLSLDSLYLIPIYDHGSTECYSKDLHLVSNEDNLFIRAELVIDIDMCSQLYESEYNDIVDKYPNDENKQNIEFEIACTKKFFDKNIVNVNLLSKDISYDWEFFNKFPKRFLNKLDISIAREYRNYIYGVSFIYYFPYRFVNMNKRRTITLAFSITT